MSRDAALAQTARVPIRTARLEGSLSLTGGRIDDLKLTSYTVSVEPGSPIVTLLNPAGARGRLLFALRLGAGRRAGAGCGAGRQHALADRVRRAR